MAVVALAGTTGAPGVTSTALALQAALTLLPGRRMITAECDPDGGAVLYGALQGRLGDRHGLHNLVTAGRRGAAAFTEAFWRQLIDLTDDGSAEDGPGDRLLLPGFAEPAQALGFAPLWEMLAAQFVGIGPHGHDVLVDLGRGGVFGPSGVLARRADAVVLVARTTMLGARSAAVRLEALREEIPHLGLLLIEEEYPADYVLQVLRKERGLRPSLVGVLPHRPRQARVFSHGAEPDRRFARGELMRAARTVAETVQRQLDQVLATRTRSGSAPVYRGEVAGAR